MHIFKLYCFTAVTQFEPYDVLWKMLKMVLLGYNVQLISPLFSLSQAWQPLLFSQIQCCPLCPPKTRMLPIQSQSHMKVRTHTHTHSHSHSHSQLVISWSHSPFFQSDSSCPLSMSGSIYFYIHVI